MLSYLNESSRNRKCSSTPFGNQWKVSMALLGWDCSLIWANAGVTEPLQLGSAANYPLCRGLFLFFSERYYIISFFWCKSWNCWACLKSFLCSLFLFLAFLKNRNVIVTACWKYFLCSWHKNVFPVLCLHFEYDLESDSWCLCNGNLTHISQDESAS